jgi:hypothetical protein
MSESCSHARECHLTLTSYDTCTIVVRVSGLPDGAVISVSSWAIQTGRAYALAAAHDAAVQMIDTSVMRVHQHGACIGGNREQQVGRSRGGLTSKIHAVVDADGLPVRLGLTAGEAHDNRLCSVLLAGLHPRTMLLADRGYDAD